MGQYTSIWNDRTRAPLFVFRSWQEKLIFVQEMMDAWLSVQKGWLYLEPVLATGGSGGDIQHLVADELKRFNAVDKVKRLAGISSHDR